jgi:hypothetical protein
MRRFCQRVLTEHSAQRDLPSMVPCWRRFSACDGVAICSRSFDGFAAPSNDGIVRPDSHLSSGSIAGVRLGSMGPSLRPIIAANTPIPNSVACLLTLQLAGAKCPWSHDTAWSVTRKVRVPVFEALMICRGTLARKVPCKHENFDVTAPERNKGVRDKVCGHPTPTNAVIASLCDQLMPMRHIGADAKTHRRARMVTYQRRQRASTVSVLAKLRSARARA